jgi:hypothetical protein
VEGYDGDLRLLDNDLDRGVKALYDNEQETIIAFLFQRGAYTEEKAREWVTAVEKEGINLTIKANVSGQPSSTFLLPGQALEMAVEDLSFADVEGLLREALEDGVMLEGGVQRWPWLIEIYAEYCIVGLGYRYYKVPYALNDMSEIEFGELQQVTKRWEPVLEAEIEETAAAIAADIRGGERKVLTFTMHDAKGLPADVATGDLIWKEIFHVSKTVRPISGDVLSVEQDMIDGLAEAFDASVFPYVPITASTHYDETGGIVPSYDSVGFVRKMVKLDGRLFGGLEIIDADVKEKIEDGRIADCSVYVWFDVYDRKDPEKVWPFVLVHLLLTNYPQIDDLEAFGIGPDAIAASAAGEGAQYQHYVEETMGERETQETPTLDPEDAKLLAEIKELRKSGFTLDGLRQQAQQVQQKARSLEIQGIVAALEGRATREDVSVIEGHRHYPAVIKAVEAALQSAPHAISADINEDGGTSADKLVLDIVNALPAEARMKLDDSPAKPDRSMDPGPESEYAEKRHRTEPLPAEVAEQVSDEAIDAFMGDMILE